MDEEKKLVTIQPLPMPAESEKPAKKNPGRPKIRPERVEKHEATPARLKALEKARIVKAAKRIDKEKKAKLAHQANLTGQAFPTQGYSFGPQIDKEASMAQSSPGFEQGRSEPMAYHSPAYGGLFSSEQLTRVENLLNRLISDSEKQNAPPQNLLQEQPIVRVHSDMNHKATIFNTNPYLSRRFGPR